MDPTALSHLQQFMRYLETERQASPHTVSAYQREVAALAAFLDENRIARWPQVQREHIRGFLALSYRFGLAAVSVNRRLSAVKSFMQFLMQEGLIKGNPAEGVAGPKAAPRPLPEVLSADQIGQIIDGIKGNDPRAVRDRAIIEMLYGSGLRLSELTALDLNDLELKDRAVRVFGKGSKERIVPVSRCARKALRIWLFIRGKRVKKAEKALFVSKHGTRITQRAVEKMLLERAEAAGIKVHVSPHMLRHSCATHMLERGAGVRNVQEMLGHESISTTQIYVHVDAAHLTTEYMKAHPRARRE